MACTEGSTPPAPPPAPPLVTPPPVTPPTDATPPSLSQRFPDQNAPAVAPDTAIRAEFSEDLASASIAGNASLKRVRDDEVIPSQPVLNGHILELSHPELDLRTTYEVTLGSGLTDLAGNRFAGTSWTFTTRDDAWRDGVQIRDGFGQGSPQLAMNAAGRAIAVWPEFANNQSKLWANWYDPVAGWRGAEPLASLGAQNFSSDIHVTLDLQGNAMVIWGQSAPGAGARSDLESSHSTGDGIWTKPQSFESEETYNAVNPDLAGDSRGNVVAVWAQGDGKRANIWANSYAVASGWGSPQLLESNDLGTANFPKVAMDEHGNAHVVWVQSEGTFGIDDSIWGNLRRAGGNWDAAFALEQEKPEANNPRIAVNANGDAVVIWNQIEMIGNQGQSHAWTNRYTPAGQWGRAKAINIQGANASYGRSIALDAKGNAVVVWLQQTGTAPPEVWANRDILGAGWETPKQLSKANGIRVGEVQVAVDSEGNGLALWSQNNSDLYASRYLSGGWSQGGAIVDGYLGGAQIAFDARGCALSVFTKTGPTIWAKEFR